MNYSIRYNKKHALKFLKKNPGVISQTEVESLIKKALEVKYKKVKHNINLGVLSGNWKGMYRIRKGNIRIIFRINNGEIIIIEIVRIGFRQGVYK